MGFIYLDACADTVFARRIFVVDSERIAAGVVDQQCRSCQTLSRDRHGKPRQLFGAHFDLERILRRGDRCTAAQMRVQTTPGR